MVKPLQTFERLCEAVQGCRVLVVEGARGVGKDHLCDRLCGHFGHRYYEYLKPRKSHVDSKGSVQERLPAGYEVQQSSFWVFDFLRQQPDLKVVCNRSLLSSMHWDGPRPDRLEVWSQMLTALEGKVIMVIPTPGEHRRRLVKRRRSHELNAAEAEYRGIVSWAHEVPKELVTWFQEA